MGGGDALLANGLSLYVGYTLEVWSQTAQWLLRYQHDLHLLEGA
jgi:hypothetical protein